MKDKKLEKVIDKLLYIDVLHKLGRLNDWEKRTAYKITLRDK